MRRKSVKKKIVQDIIPPIEMSCKNCRYAYLMQSDKANPIVAECTKTKERFVASSGYKTNCGFEKRIDEMVIHEMIYLK